MQTISIILQSEAWDLHPALLIFARDDNVIDTGAIPNVYENEKLR